MLRNLLFTVLLAFVLSIYGFVENQEISSQPHIILMVADDMGWNDIGFNNKDIISPNLDELIADGIFLNQSYMMSLCTPSRAALMTGYYPFRTGMQNNVLFSAIPSGLPLKFPTVADKLRELGYATHIIGKYETDSVTGLILRLSVVSIPSLDTIRHPNFILTIQQEIPFVKRALEVISSHDRSKPLFLYLPFQYVHNPIQVPEEFVDLYADSNVQNPVRRRFQGMVSALDNDIGQIMAALKDYGLYENSVIGFTSDNGGQTTSGGNNYPLRGWKGKLFEGGTRVPAFFHSSLLENKGYVYNGLMHAIDWMPTLLHIAGGEADPDIDGMNMWPSIVENQPSPRVEMIYNINNVTGRMMGAIRQGPWKMVMGQLGDATGSIHPEDVTGQAADLLVHVNLYNPARPQTSEDIYLFNLEDDPTEQFDLKGEYPDLMNELMKRYLEYAELSVPSVFKPYDPNGNPRYYDFTWSPGWCTPIVEPGSWHQ